MTQMKYYLEFLIILTVLSSSVMAAETLEDVQPGNIAVDLGGGYEISLVLDNSVDMYDLKVVDPKNTVIGEQYELVVYEAGKSEILVDIVVRVWPWEELYPKNNMPQKIDRYFGSIYYDEFHLEFVYLPGGVLAPNGHDIKSIVEVRGQTSDWDSGIADELPVFQSIVDTIHVSGPAI